MGGAGKLLIRTPGNGKEQEGPGAEGETETGIRGELIQIPRNASPTSNTQFRADAGSTAQAAGSEASRNEVKNKQEEAKPEKKKEEKGGEEEELVVWSRRGGKERKKGGGKFSTGA